MYIRHNNSNKTTALFGHFSLLSCHNNNIIWTLFPFIWTTGSHLHFFEQIIGLFGYFAYFLAIIAIYLYTFFFLFYHRDLTYIFSNKLLAYLYTFFPDQPNTMVVLESTANGVGDWYHEM